YVMPANLPAEAKHKFSEASRARNPQQKLRLLQEFLSLVPKHKGTEKLCAQTKRKIASLRREIEQEKQRRKVARGGPKYFIQKQGAAQIVILGPTNVGRSSLLAALTNAKPKISSYPCTTQMPIPGMFPYEDIQFQLIEAPPLLPGAANGTAWGPQALTQARNADGLILMVDLTENPIEQLALIQNELTKARILTQKPHARVEIEPRHVGAGLRIIINGKLVNCTQKQIEELLKTYRVADATIKIHGDATLDDVEDAVFESTTYHPAVIIANKTDQPKAAENLETLRKAVDNQLPIIAVSCKTKQGLKKLASTLFQILDVIRVYTKQPNQPKPSSKPFILPKNSTIQHLSKQIHSDFQKNFSHAKIWSKRLPFSPQKVGLDFVLEDGDVAEIHLK
ncbi:MAG: GTPase, partial [Thermoproteota archaeon]|nr:GTPase [Thermoproteota archaeon]